MNDHLVRSDVAYRIAIKAMWAGAMVGTPLGIFIGWWFTR